MNFNIELASQLTASTEQFPVDFDRGYEWLGYARKDYGLDALKVNFVVDVDFRCQQENSGQSGGRPINKYYLTVECFKSWGMMAGTAQGKQVRLYFLECERQLKQERNAGTINNEIRLKALLDFSAQVIDNIFVGVPLRAELLAGLKLNAAESLVPELIPHLGAARNALINNTAQDQELINVTKLGELMGLSAVATNKLLVQAGLQIKNPKKRSKKDASYLPTGRGLDFADLTLATGMGKDQTTYQQLRWYPSVVEALSP